MCVTVLTSLFPRYLPTNIRGTGINAFIYMVLGRMIHFTIPSRSLYSISASTLAIMFVSLDFVSFIIQLVGGSWAGPTSPPSRQMQGIHIYMGGIGLQQFFILIFLVLAVKFHSEMLKMEKLSTSAPLTSSKRRWRPLLYTLYGTLGLITVSRRSSLPFLGSYHIIHTPILSLLFPSPQKKPPVIITSFHTNTSPTDPHPIPPRRICIGARTFQSHTLP